MVLTYFEVSSAAGEGLASETRSGGRERWLATRCDHRSGEPVGFVWHSVESA